MSGAVPIIVVAVVGGVLTATVVLGVIAVRQHRRRKLQASTEGGTGGAAAPRDFEMQPVTCDAASKDSTSTSSRRITPPGLELDLESEDVQADLADLAVAKATCHLCGGFFCSVAGNCNSAEAAATAAASNAANSASESGDEVDNNDATLRRLRACRVRGEIIVTAADVAFRRGLSNNSRFNVAGDKDVAESDDDHNRDNEEESVASYFFHRGVQPAEHQLMERVPSSGMASLAALPGHDYRLWRCPSPHAVKSLLCHRCRPLLSFQLTPRRRGDAGGGGGSSGGEILFDHRRSGRRVWIASPAYAGPLSCLIRLPLPPPQSSGPSSQAMTIQFGAQVPDGAAIGLEASGKQFAVLQTVQEKSKAAASIAGQSVPVVDGLKPELPQQVSGSNCNLCASEQETSADADTEPGDTGNDEDGDDEDDVYTTATAAAAAAAVATAASGDLTMSDCDAASTSTVSAQTEWSSLRKRAATSAATKWAAISMQEVADQLESSSSPGVEELLPGSRSPADGSSAELATVGAADGGDSGGGSEAPTAASALSAARAAADAAGRFASLELCGKVGGAAAGGTDSEYLRFLYSSDASSSGGGGGCGGGGGDDGAGTDSEGSDMGSGGFGARCTPATGGAAAAGASRRSSTDFYTADSNVTSRCDSSQSEAPTGD